MSSLIKIAFKISNDKKGVSLVGKATDSLTGSTKAACNDFLHWFIPEDSDIVGASVAFRGTSPFEHNLLLLRWDQTTRYLLAEPFCVAWEAAGRTFDYDYCITVKTDNRQPRADVFLLGTGSLHIGSLPI